MATLERIAYTPHRIEVVDAKTLWTEAKVKSPIGTLPQLVWESGQTWAEANLWARELARSGKVSQKTVLASMTALLTYAKFLEAEGIGWWHFPETEEERCLVKYRGALVAAKDAGDMAPSTASNRMSTAVRFYRWLTKKDLLSTEWPMWAERFFGIRLVDSFGFSHTFQVNSTDLAIPNRAVAGGVRLEDGLLPVSIPTMNEIIAFADLEASIELALMLRLGFGTGLRLGSLCDLKERTISDASIDPAAGWYRLGVGPGARPAVHTKFGVSGSVPISSDLLSQVREYLTSTRRLKRKALAAPLHRDLVFLNKNGEPYWPSESRAVSVEMGRLRKDGIASGIAAFRDFHFHRARATFITELMRAALKFLPVGDAVDFVREAALHKDEATTLRYVKFLKTSKGMAAAADAFTEAFLGLARYSSTLAA